MSSRPRDLPAEPPRSERQRRFVDLYLVSLNATLAYKQAGYKAKTDKVAGVQGHRLLVKPSIQAAIQAASQKLAQRTGVDQEDVIRENQRLAFTDIRDFLAYDDDGVRLIPSSALTDDQARAVASVKEAIHPGGGKTVELRLHDKQKALAEIAARLWPVPREKEPPSAVTNNTLVLQGYTVEQLRELLGAVVEREQ